MSVRNNYCAKSRVCRGGVSPRPSAEVPGAIQEALGALRHLHRAGRCDTGSTGNLCPSGVADGGQVGYPGVPQVALGVSSGLPGDTPEHRHLIRVCKLPTRVRGFSTSTPPRLSFPIRVTGPQGLVTTTAVLGVSSRQPICTPCPGLAPAPLPRGSNRGLSHPWALAPLSVPPLTLCLISKYISRGSASSCWSLVCLSQPD